MIEGAEADATTDSMWLGTGESVVFMSFVEEDGNDAWMLCDTGSFIRDPDAVPGGEGE